MGPRLKLWYEWICPRQKKRFLLPEVKTHLDVRQKHGAARCVRAELSGPVLLIITAVVRTITMCCRPQNADKDKQRNFQYKHCYFVR
jgi:hypothetical protein